MPGRARLKVTTFHLIPPSSQLFGIDIIELHEAFAAQVSVERDEFEGILQRNNLFAPFYLLVRMTFFDSAFDQKCYNGISLRCNVYYYIYLFILYINTSNINKYAQLIEHHPNVIHSSMTLTCKEVSLPRCLYLAWNNGEFEDGFVWYRGRVEIDARLPPVIYHRKKVPNCETVSNLQNSENGNTCWNSKTTGMSAPVLFWRLNTPALGGGRIRGWSLKYFRRTPPVVALGSRK